jgi:hypothetical protein
MAASQISSKTIAAQHLTIPSESCTKPSSTNQASHWHHTAPSDLGLFPPQQTHITRQIKRHCYEDLGNSSTADHQFSSAALGFSNPVNVATVVDLDRAAQGAPALHLQHCVGTAPTTHSPFRSQGHPEEPTKQRSSRSSRSISMAELAKRLGIKTVNLSPDGHFQLPESHMISRTCSPSVDPVHASMETDDAWCWIQKQAVPSISAASLQRLLGGGVTAGGAMTGHTLTLPPPALTLGSMGGSRGSCGPLDVLASAATAAHEEEQRIRVKQEVLSAAGGLSADDSLSLKRQRIF